MALLRMENITKIYNNDVLANENVNLSLNEGEIHAIAGENGAGKSTLMKILYGLEKPNSGDIYLNDEKITLANPNDAVKLGIGMVHQHFMLVDNLTVYENIFLGSELKKGITLDRKKMIEQTDKLAKKYNMQVEPSAICGNLSVGIKQKVEILKVLIKGAKLIILDEPTAVLTPIETDELFEQLKSLKKDNCTIVIITHKLKEIKRICDRVTIMQNGKDKGVYNVADVTEKDISRLMVGNDVNLTIDKSPVNCGEEVLKVTDLTIRKNGKNVVEKVSFCVKKGEIVCFAGVEGNGQREIIRAITAMDKNYSGKIEICGVDTHKQSIKEIRNLGVSHIPEDRMTVGANVGASIFDNIISFKTTQKQFNKIGFLKRGVLVRNCDELILKFGVKCKNRKQKIGMLSGGNMQKVVIARELDNAPTLLIADQPTRGVDVGAIEFIHKKIVELRDDGKAVLLVSADLTEVFNLADKILTIYEGEITGVFTDIKNLTDVELGEFMLGMKNNYNSSGNSLEKLSSEEA